MNVKDTHVTVTGVDDENIYLQIGPMGYTFPKHELLELAYGQTDDIDTLKRNIAVAINLSGISVADDIAVKRVIEQRAFKLRR